MLLAHMMRTISFCLWLSLPAAWAAASPAAWESCNWSEWSCLKVDEARCYAYRRRECQGRREDQFLTSNEEQVSAGTVCFREDRLSGCRGEPLLDSSRLPPPNWCPWTAWSDWQLECRASLGGMQHLAGLITLANDSNGFAYSSRTRGCYCPASPDPGALACPGAREQWRAAQLSSIGLQRPACHWCSWGAWQPDCACSGSGVPPSVASPNGQKLSLPIRRRACLCSDGSFGANATADCGGDSGAIQTAASLEAVCPACSRGLREVSADNNGYYRAASFLNPLAIGFAVYLLAALGAFLVCRVFCGDPRQSDANSRDQLSVDDFLVTPSANAATSAV